MLNFFSSVPVYVYVVCDITRFAPHPAVRAHVPRILCRRRRHLLRAVRDESLTKMQRMYCSPEGGRGVQEKPQPFSGTGVLNGGLLGRHEGAVSVYRCIDVSVYQCRSVCGCGVSVDRQIASYESENRVLTSLTKSPLYIFFVFGLLAVPLPFSSSAPRHTTEPRHSKR